jgi:hypothetical protein
VLVSIADDGSRVFFVDSLRLIAGALKDVCVFEVEGE